MSCMSDGDNEPAEDAPAEGAEPDEEEPEEPGTKSEPGGAAEVTVEELDRRLDEAETDVEDAETEAELDGVEAELDAIESDLEAADLPEPEDEDDEDPAERLRGRLEDAREALEEARGPYAADVVAEIESAKETLTDTRWTESGEAEAKAAVETFLDATGDELDATFTVDGTDLDAYANALDEVAGTVEVAGLDPDEDDDVIETLLAATDDLQADLDDAEEWADLTVVQQLQAQGFYDRLTSENRKDFPPELSVVRIAEREKDADRILLALEKLTSDFMEENCIDALARLGAPEAYDAMMQRAQKRDRPAIEVLGKIGDPDACDTLHEFIQDESNPPLQKTTLKALGEIGSEESTQAAANRLVAEDPEVRSQAARALGLIGDTRAVAPLRDVLADDEDGSVRASAAWALVQIGTETALEAAREYADDRSYLVQSEAEKAEETLSDAEAPAA